MVRYNCNLFSYACFSELVDVLLFLQETTVHVIVAVLGESSFLLCCCQRTDTDAFDDNIWER